MPLSGENPVTAGTGVTPTTSVPAPTLSPTASGPPLPRPPRPRRSCPRPIPGLPRRGEVSAAVKARATSLRRGRRQLDHRRRGGLAAARRRAAAAGHSPALADALAPLLGTGDAAVSIVRDAQYGGILGRLVERARRRRPVARPARRVRSWRAARRSTSDSSPASPRWRVTEALPARPGSPAASLTSTARKVLADTRIRLPHAARSDVLAGTVHDSVLSLLAALSREHVVDVSVLRSGHPLHVFGTSRTSDHPRGRASTSGRSTTGRSSCPRTTRSPRQPCASAWPTAPTTSAARSGSSGRQYFSDRTHQDHVHLGLNR